MLHERQEGRQPLAGSKFQGNSKTGPSNSWAFRATQPPPRPAPAAFLGTVILAACTVLGHSRKDLCPPGALCYSIVDCPMWEQVVQGGVGPQAQAWGIMHLQPYPKLPPPTHMGKTTWASLTLESGNQGRSQPQPAVSESIKEMF